MTIPAGILALTDAMRTRPTKQNIKRLADLLELQVHTLANIVPPPVGLQEAIGEAAAMLAPIIPTITPVDAAAAAELGRLQTLLGPLTAVGGGSSLAQASSYLPLVGTLVTVGALAFGGYWLFIGRKKRRGAK